MDRKEGWTDRQEKGVGLMDRIEGWTDGQERRLD